MKPKKWIYLFIVPGGILYLIFFVLPTISALFYSVTDWNGIAPNYNFVGLKNFKELLFNDIVFHKAAGNNMKFLLAVVTFQTLFSLIFALILVKNTKPNVFFRTLYFFPTILASISVAFIWTFVYDSNLGMLNNFLQMVGLENLIHSWLGDRRIAIYSIALVQVWAHTGQVMVMFIAGLQAIPEEIYEAAKIDGANRWQIFRRITWPLLAPSTTMVVGYTMIQSFKAFDLIFAMTGGGPVYSTEIFATFIYRSAFTNYAFGYASAASVIFMMVIATLTYLQNRAINKMVN
ncbi:MAG: sugar ABC transporter permease [Clostridia bacterium]|nr:sugar ABC transporter permease [Clostridia bacterium]